MTTPTPDEICERLRAEADLCRNEGATDIAELLDAAEVTIERLSAALEHLIDIIDGTEATGFDPHVEQMLMDAAETGRAALGKDVRDDHSPGSSEGECAQDTVPGSDMGKGE